MLSIVILSANRCDPFGVESQVIKPSLLIAVTPQGLFVGAHGWKTPKGSQRLESRFYVVFRP